LSIQSSLSGPGLAVTSSIDSTEIGRLLLDNIPSSTPSKALLLQGIGFNMKQSAPALMKVCSMSFADRPQILFL
jgi:hypothetical protein